LIRHRTATLRAAIIAFAALMLAAACTSTAPRPAPQWDAIPSNITDALCTRLRGDRFSDQLALVRITQPIVTADALRALYSLREMPYDVKVPPTRAIPVELGSSCTWTPIEASQRERYRDAVTVELSAPLLNPADASAAGLFARVSAGGVSEWYWIALRPRNETWAMTGIAPITVH
jgi:hypothetical protein